MKQRRFLQDRLPTLIAELEAMLAELDAMGVHLAGVHVASALADLRAWQIQKPTDRDWPGFGDL